MSTEQNPTLSFEQIVQNKLKENFESLFSPEEFQPLITKAVENVFFKAIPVHSGYFGTPTENPPYFVQKVGEMAKPMIEAEIAKWFENNPNFVKQQVRKVIEEGIVSVGIAALDNRLRSHLHPFMDKLTRSF